MGESESLLRTITQRCLADAFVGTLEALAIDVAAAPRRHSECVRHAKKTLKKWAQRKFNNKLRNECLSVEWFRNRREAVILIEAWRRQ